MTKLLVLTGVVVGTTGKGKKRVNLGPGADVTEIPLPDKAYGLSSKDVDRIIGLGCGYLKAAKSESEKDDQPPPANTAENSSGPQTEPDSEGANE